jgi:hypothetical protein
MCKYMIATFKYDECGHIMNQTVWDECAVAEEAKKRCEGKMAFPVESGSMPFFGSSRKKGWCPDCNVARMQK